MQIYKKNLKKRRIFESYVVYINIRLKHSIKTPENIKKIIIFRKKLSNTKQICLYCSKFKNSGSASRVPFSFYREKSGPSGAKYL